MLNFVTYKMLKIIIPIVVICMAIKLKAQPKTDSLMLHIFDHTESIVAKRVLQNPANYRLQIIYTEIFPVLRTFILTMIQKVISILHLWLRCHWLFFHLKN